MTKICSTCKLNNRREQSKRYKAERKQEISEYNKNYKKEKKQEISEYNKQYFINNSTAIKIRRHGYTKDYHLRNPQAKLHHNMRTRMTKILRNQRSNYSSRKLLGCDTQMFQDWLEFQFQFNPGYTLDNYGSMWHMDHCVPCSKFNITLDNDIKRCFHWSNIKPMDPEKNNEKNNTTSRPEQLLQWFRAKAFLYHYSHKYSRTTYTITPLITFAYIS
jgi:hypothetical protein